MTKIVNPDGGVIGEWKYPPGFLADMSSKKCPNCRRPVLDHTIDEAIACGILTMDHPPSGETALNLVCGSCGKKHSAHTFNELWNTDDHHTYRNTI